MDGVEIVLAEQRQVRLGTTHIAGLRDDEHRTGALELGFPLWGRQPRVQRLGDRAQLHQRVKEDHVVDAHGELQGHSGPEPDAVSGQPPGSRGGLGLQLLVGEMAPFDDQCHAVGTCLGALGEPVVQDHPQG